MNDATQALIEEADTYLANWDGDYVERGTDMVRRLAAALSALSGETETERAVAERAWAEGYSVACREHNNFEGCGKPDSHGHSNVNPYRKDS